MTKVFRNGSGDHRAIMIRIEESYIEFFYHEQYIRQQVWKQEQEEKKSLEGQEDNEENEVNGFYWINADEWIFDRTGRQDREDNWHKHMKTKNWFTQEMYDYIDKNANR
jgi:hypothetical protein